MFAVSEWPSLVVALALLLTCGGLMGIALVRHPVDQALKVWNALGPLLGLITGVAGAYFFNDARVRALTGERNLAQSQLAVVNAEAQQVRMELVLLRDETGMARARLAEWAARLTPYDDRIELANQNYRVQVGAFFRNSLDPEEGASKEVEIDGPGIEPDGPGLRHRFTFTVLAHGAYRIESDGDVRLVAALYGSSVTPLKVDTGGAVNMAVELEPGQYTLVVRAWLGEEEIVDYAISVRFMPELDEP